MARPFCFGWYIRLDRGLLDLRIHSKAGAMTQTAPLFDDLRLPCGVILNNRIAKSAMSDSLGDGQPDAVAV